MKSIKTYFKIGIYLPVCFVHLVVTAVGPFPPCVLWWSRTRGAGGEGLEHRVRGWPRFVQELRVFKWPDARPGIVHRSSFKKTNNPAVFNLRCQPDAIPELCFSADSGEGHSLSHLCSFQQVWAVWGSELPSSLFAAWFGSTPGVVQVSAFHSRPC